MRLPSCDLGKVCALLLLLAPQVSGQSFELDKRGGALGRPLQLELKGEAGRPYWILYDCVETEIELAPGVTLQVGFDHLAVSAVLPGFTGVLGGDGRASAEVLMPDDPIVDPETISFQALYCDAFDVVSNLVRVTPAPVGEFEAALSEPLLPISSGVAAPQPDGSILFAADVLPVIQRYDPDLEEFTATDLACSAPLLSASAVLPDGRVFISGGLALDGSEIGQPTDRCVLLDPATGECREFFMGTPRAGHGASVTADGQILISGGFQSFDLTDLLSLFQGILGTTERFDPQAGSFSAAASLLEPKAFHTSTATADGDVLLTGGLTLLPILDIPLVSFTAYRYLSASDDFSLPILMDGGRMLHTAALLDNDRIVHAGGVTIDFADFLESGDIADLKIGALDDAVVWRKGSLFDGFDSAPGMSAGRALPAVAALPGARALVAGGFELELSGSLEDWVFEAQASADLYESLGFAATGEMAEARIWPLAAALGDGTVLVVGGGGLSGEIYHDR